MRYCYSPSSGIIYQSNDDSGVLSCCEITNPRSHSEVTWWKRAWGLWPLWGDESSACIATTSREGCNYLPRGSNSNTNHRPNETKSADYSFERLVEAEFPCLRMESKGWYTCCVELPSIELFAGLARQPLLLSPLEVLSLWTARDHPFRTMRIADFQSSFENKAQSGASWTFKAASFNQPSEYVEQMRQQKRSLYSIPPLDSRYQLRSHRTLPNEYGKNMH